MRVVYFDGHCNLCNGFVDHLIHRDPDIFFASLQSAEARRRLPAACTEHVNTLVYEEDDKFQTESDAAIGALKKAYPWLTALRIIPRPLRNIVYRLIARNRYRVFGRRETCRLPSPSERARFLA